MKIRFCLILLIISLTFPVLAQTPVPNQLRLTIESVEDSQFPEIEVFFTLTNFAGRAVTDLSPSMISGTYQGQPVTVNDLADISANNSPRYVMLVLDLTSSVSASYLDEQKETAQIIIDELDANDRVGVVIFDTASARVLIETTFDHGAVQNEIEQLEVVNGPSNTFHDGLYQALNHLQTISTTEDIQRVVIVLTDVENPQGTRNKDEILRLSQTINAPMHLIGFGDATRDLLDEYSLPTDGFTYLERDRSQGDLRGLAEDVAGVISQEYQLFLTLNDVTANNNSSPLSLTVDIGGGISQTASTNIVARQQAIQVTLPNLTNGELVSGIVNFEPQISYANNNESPTLATVDYSIVRQAMADEALSPPNTANPNYEWDTNGLAGGDYTIRVTATDIVGNVGSHTVLLRIARSLSVEITQPTADSANADDTISVESGTINVEALVQSDFSVNQVTLYVDGEQVADPLQTPPYIFEWNSGDGTAVGLYNLRVVAQDVNGVEAFDEIVVNVSIGSSGTAIFLVAISVVLALVGLFIFVAFRRRSQQRRFHSSNSGDQIYITEDPAVNLPPEKPVLMLEPTPPVATLSIITSPHEGQQSFPLKEGIFKLGRQQAENDIVIRDRKISREHAQISVDNGQVRYQDLNGERNPSFVNDEKIDGVHILYDGDQLRLGDTTFKIKLS